MSENTKGHSDEHARLLALVEVESPPADSPDSSEMVEVWPHLVFIELNALLVVSAGLWLASLLFDAPLEEMATSAYTPKIAKAPWYFVGLQELLVYFDPWIAGVIVPGIIIVGLAAIPYLDRKVEHVGEWAPRKRPLAYAVFTLGLVLWFGLIFIGIFDRGPNWSWYWPWESWTVEKPATPVAFSLPPLIGGLSLLLYTGLGLFLPAWRWPQFYRRLGRARYAIVMALMLGMLAVPIKIALRLLFNIRYIVETPWFNV